MLQFEVTQYLAGRLVRHDIKHSRMGRVRLEVVNGEAAECRFRNGVNDRIGLEPDAP